MMVDLQDLAKTHRRLYALAEALREGDVVDARVELTRLPKSPERTLTVTVEDTDGPPGVGPEGVPGMDLWVTDADGEDWRFRIVKPGTVDSQPHHGTANVYMADHWASNTGVVRDLDPHARDGGGLIGGYAELPMDEARCPGCGNEQGNVHLERVGRVQPVPPAHSGKCPECGHHDHPIAFHQHWKWERMGEDEREQAREAAERYAARMAEHQESASYLSQQREP